MATQPNDLKYCAKDKTKNGCAPCIEYRKKAGESARAQVAAARASGTRPLINIELMPGYAEMRARCDACIASAPPRACDLDELIEYNNVEVVGPGNCEGAPVPAPAPSFGRRMWTQFANFVGVAPAVVR
jgi:hypothetical protein